MITEQEALDMRWYCFGCNLGLTCQIYHSNYLNTPRPRRVEPQDNNNDENVSQLAPEIPIRDTRRVTFLNIFAQLLIAG